MHFFEFFLQLFKLFIGEVFQIDEPIASALHPMNKFIKFKLRGFGLPVLSVLNQKHHEKSNDGGGRINHQLPRVRKVKKRAQNNPAYDYEACTNKSPGASYFFCCVMGKFSKCVFHISLLLHSQCQGNKKNPGDCGGLQGRAQEYDLWVSTLKMFKPL
jgi:hypothetical protein